MPKIGGRNRRDKCATSSLGKYYSNANSVTFADSDSFAVAKHNIDIVAFRFACGIAFGDVRISDFEPDARPISTSALRAKRVLLMQLHAAFKKG